MDRPVEVRIVREADAPTAWDFDIRLGDQTSGRIVRLRLAWADYEHWSGGRLAPEEVAAAVMRCAVEAVGEDAIPEREDAATFRRTSPGFDERLTEHLPR